MNKISIILLCLWTGVTSAQAIDSTAWRQVFKEPQLVGLIETALAHNADLMTAHLNVVQAEAQLKAARLAFFPSLTAGVEGQLSKTKDQSTAKTYQMPVTMQWEIDLAGRLRGEKRSAVASYWSMAETERAVRLQLIAAVATHYYQLVMMDEQLDVTRENIEIARQTVETMETLKEVGMQNEAAVSAARATWLNVSAQEKTLLQQIQATENALRVIIGKPHHQPLPARDGSGYSFIHHSDSCQQDILLPSPFGERLRVGELCSGMGSGVRLLDLANRPDVRAAEYALKSQIAQTDVARAAFYPQLTISASAGWTNHVGEVVNPAQILLSAIGSLVQPLFNRGQNRANLRVAKARQEQALVAFNQSLLVAGAELSDALNACQLSQERLALREQEVVAAQQAYDTSVIVMQNSSATYLEVLTAQQALLQSRLARCSDRFDLVQGQINLFKALGGG